MSPLNDLSREIDGHSTSSETTGNGLCLKDITVRFSGEDTPDSGETRIQLRFSDTNNELSVVEEVELEKVGHSTWASASFVNLPFTGAESLICTASWPDGLPIASFLLRETTPLALIKDTLVQQLALKGVLDSNTHDTILSFVNGASRNTPVQKDINQDIYALLDPIDSADPNFLRHLPFTLPPTPSLLRDAGQRFLRRCKENPSRTLHDSATACYERIVRLTHPSDQHEEYFSYMFNALEVFMLRRGINHKDPQDLPEIRRRVVMMTRITKSATEGGSASDHNLPPTYFYYLGQLLFWKYFITESADDISQSVCALAEQVRLLDTDNSSYASAVKSLCIALSVRHQNGVGTIDDVALAIEHTQTLLQHTSPSDSEARAGLFTNLASWYRNRSIATMSADDATLAIQNQREAIALTLPGSPQYKHRLISLATHTEWRSNVLKSLDDCNEAISICETVIQSNGPEGDTPPQQLSVLASNLRFRATLTNNLPDLSRAISLLRTAIEATPPNTPSYNSLLVGLGQAFFARFDVTRAISDYQSGTNALEKAIEAGYFPRASGLNALGARQQHLFAGKGSIEHLSGAIEKLKASVDLTPETDYHLPGRLDDLAQALTSRYKTTGDTDDINDAVSLHERIVSLTPMDSIYLGHRLARLASTLEERFKEEDNEDDLEAAISVAQKAVSNVSQHPTQRPLEPVIKGQLAQVLHHRFIKTRDSENLKTALSLASPIAEDPTKGPTYRLPLASQCALWSMWLEDKENALRYGSIAIELLVESVSFEQTVRDRYDYLLTVYIYGISCAGIALHFNQVERGLEWLEQGRCLVWSQISQLQTPLDSLRAQRPDLARKLEEAGKLLRSTGSRDQGTTALSFRTLTIDARQVQEHTDAAQEWYQTLKEIRSIEHFSDFLRPPNAASLLERLPQECVISNPLSGFSNVKASILRDKLKTYLKETNHLTRSATRGMSWADEYLDSQVLSSVLADLWVQVVKPVVDALKLKPRQSNSPRPRIWWCPTGQLSFLPLHAAGIYGGDYAVGSCISDYAISSYSPNVTTLLNKLEESSRHIASANRLLLVGQSDTPGLPPIPATADEIRAIQAIIQGANIPCAVIEGEEAKLGRVTDAMKAHGWVHFACHAVQNPTDPLKSGFHLHAGQLELLEIIKGVPNTDHAFLSACQTSTGDESLAEEVVHIAASMLSAGYRGVVATMWSIQDSYGPVVAKEFYQCIVDEAERRGDATRVDSSQSAYALDHAVQRLREVVGDEEDGLLAWVPYVHLGI